MYLFSFFFNISLIVQTVFVKMPVYKDIFSISKRAIKNRINNTNVPNNSAELPTNLQPDFVEILSNNVDPTSDLCTSHNEPTNDNYNTTSENTLRENVIEPQTLEKPMDTLNVKDLSEFLRNWALKNGIKQNALNEQLVFFNKYFPNLPRDSRTFLQTPKKTTTIPVAPGNYIHLGLKNGLENILKSLNSIPSEALLSFNIDGLPISRSSSSSFWVIQSKASFSKKIMIVGVYHGYQKPKCFNEFLRPFVNELNSICVEFKYKNIQIKISIDYFILDTPARASCLGLKNHGGYSSCPRCFVEGDYLNGRMTYQSINSRRRTNENFRSHEDKSHHNQISILEELDLDLVNLFPFDALHIVHLGVMKRLLRMWTKGTIESLLPSRNIIAISRRIEQNASNIPDEFQKHHMPSLSKLHEYKASQYRTFLLYMGPFVLQNIIPKLQYDHFLLLHIAIQLLSHENVPISIIKFTQQIIDDFIEKFKTVYGKHHIVYIVHALCHIPEDCARFGPLDSFSSYQFESFNYKIKRMLRKSDLPLSQIHHRLEELNYIDENVNESNKNTYPVLKFVFYFRENNIRKKGYKEILFEKFKINYKQKDRWFLTKTKKIVKFIHAEYKKDDLFLYGAEVKHLINFYDSPIASSNINVYQTSCEEELPSFWKIDDVANKMMCLENKNEIIDWVTTDDEYEIENNAINNYRVFFPLIHSNDFINT